MPSELPEGQCCQSCGMPLKRSKDFGTNVEGLRINDYCRFCFSRGAFTEPKITMQGMIDKCAGIMAKRGIMPEPQARALMTEIIPKLKRWQGK